MLPLSISLAAIVIIGTLVFVILISALLLYIILYQQKVSKFQNKIIEEKIRKQEEIFAAIQLTEENERKRIAEELHDGIGANLSGMLMSMEYLHTKTEGFDALVFQKIISTLNNSIQEIREISRNLKPNYLAKIGIEESLQDYVFHLNNYRKCQFDLHFNGPIQSIPVDLQLNLFRICCELLNNVRKHADASKSSLQLSVHSDQIILTVEDNGIGIPKNRPVTGIGLENIRSRLLLYKGKLTIDSSVNGSTFIIEIPINE